MTIFKQTHESDKDSAKTPEKFSQCQKKKFIFKEISAGRLNNSDEIGCQYANSPEVSEK
ncbi:hypothetical protein [Nodularia sp. UHCC 0506]|uniref:hypothetical protein n=1 Tax=Nodularia sp. UHCC 0506 TaxID=3110243 RepID=UPI002B21F199|nr:hypothetical protein [Nodularia sp. UHCC 0506]MEA5513862.1 hypothetical protein [Nodularia sp. UHCC 0506]